MKKKERPILIVIGNNKNGGIAKHATMLANGFSDKGRKVTIVVTKDDENNSFFELKQYVNILRIRKLDENTVMRRTIYFKIKFLKYVSNLLEEQSKQQKLLRYSVSKIRQTLNLKQALISYKDPIIIVLGLNYVIDVFYATRGKKCSIVYATKTYAEGELEGYDKGIILPIINKISCVVCQTEYTANYFKELGIQKTEIIGNPLELEVLPYVGGRNKSIVNFCRISKEKKLDLLILAFSKFYRKYSEYHIDIYGNIVNQTEEEYKAELLDLIDKLKLNEHIKIHPARKDIHQVVKDAAMFVSTSEFEGLSNSMIEAMALGLPCICTDCDGGGAREQIKNGINGLLIPKNDEDALVEAMMKYAEDEVFASMCGKNATAIREKLEISRIVTQWQDVINKYCS